MSEPRESILWRSVEAELQESYLRYSMSVIIARALPDARDGLKPSQRRILYAMRQLNLGPNAKHRKCAKIAGDTSGDYHPHGEQVIYPTLARMAQSWAMRYPLIQGQGNFGSIDGDPPAAMRYTEARMTASTVQLMEDLEKETVTMVSNYDETRQEPTVFPAKFPNLLANGSSGIAVGMATNIPSHHLGELVQATLLVLKDEEVSVEKIMSVMPGPDFATGGIICSRRGIVEAYTTGRGKLLVRAAWHLEGDIDRQGQIIVIDQIPFNVNKSRLIEQIAHLIQERELTGISDLRDESDKSGIRIVLELKRHQVAEIIVNHLCKYTDMQVTFGCNLLVLDNGLPQTLGIRPIIQAWIEHRIEIICRRTQFELKRAELRAHIVEGYLKALDLLDRVIATIRASDNRERAKGELIEIFGFSDRQSAAILELRLYQLTGLERENLEGEHRDLSEKIAHYRAILNSEELVKEIIAQELNAILKGHKEPRRTQIEEIDVGLDQEDFISNDRVIITLSGDDYIKRMALTLFKEQRRGGQGVSGVQMKKVEDALKDLLVADAHDYLLIFTNLGRCYWLKAWQVPDAGRRSKGKPIIQLLENLQEGEKVATLLRVKEFDAPACILLCSKRGVVKKTQLSAYSSPRRRGINAILIDEGDEIIAAKLVHEQQQVMLFTSRGMAVRFSESDVRAMGRISRGVRGVRLKDTSDRVVGCEIVHNTDSVLVVCEKGYGKRSQVQTYRQTSRGGVGVRSIITSDRNGWVVAALSVANKDGVLLMTSSGQAVRMTADDLRVMGRATQGVRLMNLKGKDLLIGAQKLLEESELITEQAAVAETKPLPLVSTSTEVQ